LAKIIKNKKRILARTSLRSTAIADNTSEIKEAALKAQNFQL